MKDYHNINKISIWKNKIGILYNKSYIYNIILYKKKDHVIPFGPFLAAGATLLLLLQFNLDMIINFYR